MDKPLSLFRVFDLAFFAPGGMLLAAIWCAEGGKWPMAPNVPSGWPGDVYRLGVALIAAYILGLATQGLQRVLWRAPRQVWRRLKPEQTAQLQEPWYARQRQETLNDLATYFWYLRAICWNLAIAGVVSLLLLVFGPATSQQFAGPLPWIGAGLFAAVMIVLGYDYDRALHRATTPKSAAPADPKELAAVLKRMADAVEAAGVAGPQGPAGAAGATGPTGLSGRVGPGGPEGPSGATGSTGPTGPVGPTGPAGVTGCAGASGPTGPVGPIGPAAPPPGTLTTGSPAGDS